MRDIKEDMGLALLCEGSLEQNVANLASALRERLEVVQMSKISHLPKPKKVAALKHSPAPKLDMPKPVSTEIEDTRRAISALLTSSSAPKDSLHVLHHEIIGDCVRCKLCEGRNKLVFGVGNEAAELVFVGEGPGADEDLQGEPFVGRAGKLLTKMIEAMGFSREQVYICNVVKCRPPENRDPEPEEVEACEPFLKAQLAIIKPKVIVALGRYACQCLLRTTEPMGKIRGEWRTYEGIALMPTFHPAYLLRSPTKKREVWEDLQKVMQVLGST